LEWRGVEDTKPKENVMILAFPLAMLGAAFLAYVHLATR
jgi:hypothetical protein